MNKTPTTLIIMDGFGLSDEVKGNAVRGANTPVLDRLNGEYAHTQLSASGLDVGLPAGQMGNSEVGHTNIGGGRVVFQDLPRISRAIEDGTFFENPAYNAAMDACLEKGTALHLYGLLSNGGVHSTVEHVWALLKMAGIKGLKRVYLHCFLDGRDVSPTSGADFVAEAQKKCAELGVGKIATVMGRYYAMDRDKRWDRLERAYDAMVYGEGIQNPDPVAAIRESYQNGVTDEFVEPVVCDKEGTISDNDAIIFFNYRPDRAREITRAFVDPAFDGFQREYFPVTYVCNTEYDATMPNVLVAFPRITIHNGLGEYLSKLGLTQLRIAETEKYAHVTFFFNGGVEAPYPGEDRVLVASPKVATYDLQPEMSAYEVTEKCVERIESGAYDALVYGEGIQNADPVAAIKESDKNGVTDEFVEPSVCDKAGTISDNDSIIFFNYRPDRAREITRAFVDPAFDGFQREYFPVTYVCNTEYDATMPNVQVAFPRITIRNGLGEYLGKLGLTQLRIAETEKYAHVTFFFNGGVEAPYPGEDRVLVASPKVATYDLQPEMSAHEVTEKCVERIESGAYDVIILNFANCDMVGHTGNYEAAVKAVETVDECVGRVVDATLKMGGIAMITADHGNAEQMLQSDGVSPMTAHTTNPVPFILCGAGNELREGRLADIAPTILDVMGLEKPEEMDGQSLILR